MIAALPMSTAFARPAPAPPRKTLGKAPPPRHSLGKRLPPPATNVRAAILRPVGSAASAVLAGSGSTTAPILLPPLMPIPAAVPSAVATIGPSSASAELLGSSSAGAVGSGAPAASLFDLEPASSPSSAPAVALPGVPETVDVAGKKIPTWAIGAGVVAVGVAVFLFMRKGSR